jgi:hypothetical protein
MSELRAATVSNLAGTGPVTLTGQYAAKAWVNFNGTGTVAIRESGNVSSITDNAAGDYTVNFTTAMLDGNYSVSGFINSSGNAARSPVLNFQRTDAEAGDLPATTSVRIITASGSTTASNGTRFDPPNTCVSIHR